MITLVVPTYNRRDELFRCLNSIKSLSETCPVLVVDDGGTDGTGQMIKKHFPVVNYIHLEQNKGPAYARNKAIENIRTSYVAFFDSDVVLSSDWLKAALSNIVPDTILAGRVEQPEGSLEWGPRKTMFWGGSLPCSEKRANVASSNNMIIPLELARSIGGFSEELGIYFEDSYFCICARRAGYKVRYVDKAKVIHYHNSRPTPERARRLLRNRTYTMIRDSRFILLMTIIQLFVTLFEIIVSLLRKKGNLARASLAGLFSGINDAWSYRRKRREFHL